LDDTAKKAIIVAIGVLIIITLNAICLLSTYWAIKYSVWDAFIIAVIITAIADVIGIGVWLTEIIFHVKSSDLEKIKIDNIPK
jgi:hypothetical protein